MNIESVTVSDTWEMEDTQDASDTLDDLRLDNLRLQDALSHVEKENRELKRKLEFKEDMIQQLMENIMSEQSQPKQNDIVARKVTNKFIEYKAKWLYYRDNKHQSNMNEDWRDVKKKLDIRFKEETDHIRQQYMSAAVQCLKDSFL